MPGTRVADNPDRSQYELYLGDERVGLIAYRRRPDAIALVHTEIDPVRQEKGLGSTLVRGALDDIRSRGEKVVPQCSFVRAFVEEHDEYADLVAG